jgi:hypothetical protein
MRKQQKPVVNPRLTNTVKRRRKLAARALAFRKVGEALDGFEAKTRIVALQAHAALLGLRLG